MTDLERQLVEKSQQGDIESFELLIKNYQKLAFNIAFRMLGNTEDAADATQDAMIKVYKSISSFKGNSNFSTWLYRIVTNTCLDALRKKKKDNLLSYDKNIETEEGALEREIPDTRNMPEELVERKEHIQDLAQAINALPEQHRVVIVLRDIKGFSYDQIAEILDCSQGTIKSRISRARIALKETLKKNTELYKNHYVKI
ncbi:RNA polymerase sigma factor [Geosporobacter ferrireducens]|uniref:RNA polymerase subunit sigma-24 n=1 Tax=Geosporobacter ferrireducens TaxID=1424294 RepID=A0A1D8GP45_9FIRM|nr:sigma-70 family RNA polymerase sigma factor [Geosporobacter ferrireducens]AOT72726.1 RNA polymerase subunit sigma-24 [Geosporobacter ferrireducens]MTI55136.1 sigma-70 family RNA polymerase sigma factor [Geosporobacter ferrireducens]